MSTSSAAAKAILISRAATFPHLPPTSTSHNLRPFKKRSSPITALISGVDNGGVSDEFVSTRKSVFTREFSVLSNLLRRIEPLDNSTIGKSVSESAKDSMKQTISTMLGLLPSDQFGVSVTVSRFPLHRIIASSIVTGYTLWNAEYRVSLMRNFDMSSATRSSDKLDVGERDGGGGLDVRYEASDCVGDKGVGGSSEVSAEELERMSLENLGKLSPEALKYIHQLELEVLASRQELHAQRRENLEMEHIRKSNNNLLEYLRSLESDMVSELSRPSAPEVEEIIQQLAQNTLRKFFTDESSSNNDGDNLALSNMQNYQDADSEFCDTVVTSRDYLAKLLFWCMLLGHHLRGLENRLHLSCVVGLL